MTKVKNPKQGFLFYEQKESTPSEQVSDSTSFYEEMNQRRSVREFSNKEIPKGIIENIIKTASTAPSGAHKQPWFFAVVRSAEMKKKIRIAAEKEEYENYHGRMSDDWLKDLEKFDTHWNKPLLEIAPLV